MIVCKKHNHSDLMPENFGGIAIATESVLAILTDAGFSDVKSKWFKKLMYDSEGSGLCMLKNGKWLLSVIVGKGYYTFELFEEKTA